MKKKQNLLMPLSYRWWYSSFCRPCPRDEFYGSRWPGKKGPGPEKRKRFLFYASQWMGKQTFSTDDDSASRRISRCLLTYIDPSDRRMRIGFGGAFCFPSSPHERCEWSETHPEIMLMRIYRLWRGERQNRPDARPKILKYQVVRLANIQLRKERRRFYLFIHSQSRSGNYL